MRLSLPWRADAQARVRARRWRLYRPQPCGARPSRRTRTSGARDGACGAPRACPRHGRTREGCGHDARRPCCAPGPRRRPCDGRHDARHGPRVGLDAGHGSGHAQSLLRGPGLRHSRVLLFPDGEDVRRLPDAVRAGRQALSFLPRKCRDHLSRLAFLRGGVARAAQRRRQHGHVGRAVGGHRLPVQHRRDLLLRG